MDRETFAANASHAETPWQISPLFHRLFGRHMLNAALLVCLVAAFVGPINAKTELLNDPDIWWHLADARVMFSTHHAIQIEPYSFTVRGQRWIDPEWLSEVPYWIGYSSLGLVGINLAAFIAFSANLLFVYFRSASKSRHNGAAFWTAVLGFFLMAVNAGPRTIQFAYLAMSAEMLILDAAENGKWRPLWLLPPLFCLWINLHGSWVIGLGLLALYILCGLVPFNAGVFAQDAFSRTDRNRLILVFMASVAALFANPYGWRLVWNPFDMMLNQKLIVAITQEWHPLNLGASAGMAAAVFIGLMIVANCVRGRKWKIYELAFILFAWYVAFEHQRFAFMACIITAPWLAVDLARSFFPPSSEKTIPAFNALFVVGVACFVVFILPSQTALQSGLSQRYPFHSIALIQPSWRTFNDHSLGGWMDFNSKPTFIDSRNDTFEHHGVLQDYLAIQNLQDSSKLMDRYAVDHALIQANTPLSFALEHSPSWRVEMQEGTGDNQYVLFAKTDGQPVDKAR
ncbi:MAG TPA: hypothetical protein VGG45_18490 [Terracidiphilus sp.]|jgi:hypothetical protein